MPVAGREDIPVPGKILVLGHLHLGSRVRYITGFSLAPDADVRVQILHKFDETVISVALIGPHPVLDVPIEQLILLPFPASDAGKGKKQKDGGQKFFHSANLILSLDMVVLVA